MTAATLGDAVRAHLERLLPVFDLEASRARVLDTFELVTRESLALDVDAPLPRFSTINNDGVPLELSLSLGGGGGGLRLLTEIGVPGSSVPSRIALTRARLGPLLRQLGLTDAGPALEHALASLVPSDPADLIDWRGGLWVALAFLPGDRTGLRLYVNDAVGDLRARWLRATRLLARLGRMEAMTALCELSPLVSAFAQPLGVALEVEPHGLGRVKLYLRSTRVAGAELEAVLAATGLTDGAPRLRQFLAVLQGARAGLPPSSIVLSLEFPTGPHRIDVKIDGCCHCVFASDVDAHAAAGQLVRAWDLPRHAYDAVLRELAGATLSSEATRHHAFFGLGLTHGQAPRLNLYLKPALAPRAPSMADVPAAPTLAWPRAASTADVAAAPLALPRPRAASALPARARRSVDRALGFVLDLQSPGGQWIDFALPVGPSDAWVTAYVGAILAELPAAHATARVRDAVERAADWCVVAMGPDHGWGYNAFTGSDADSTAHAIRFLRAAGRAVPDACLARLRAFQRPDGGFATYRRTDPDDTWGHSHADVTPAALLALAPHPPSQAAVEAGLTYAAAQQDDAGCWPSYWWRTHDYATHANLRALHRLEGRCRADACADGCRRDAAARPPFEAALRLASLSLLDALSPSQRDPALAALVEAQDADGSWPSSPMLRLTDPTCAAPWTRADAGRLFADQRRIFTTATVLAAVVEVLAHAAGATPPRRGLAR